MGSLSCRQASVRPPSVVLHAVHLGDLFMSLIHTCQLCGVNSFDYLVELQRHARELAACPTEWMPWNCRETLARNVQLFDSAEL